MDKDIKIQLKRLYKMKIPQYLYDKELITIIVLHEEFAGFALQLLNYNKLSNSPNVFIDDDERLLLNELLQISEIRDYIKFLLKIESIFNKFKN